MTEHKQLKPLIVSVKQARQLLGNLSHQKFWRLVREGHFELLGSKAKRYVTMASIEAYVAKMERYVARLPANTASAETPSISTASLTP